MLKWSLSFRVELLSVFLDQNVSSSHVFFLLVLVAVTNCRAAEIWQHVKWEEEKRVPKRAFAKKCVFDAFKLMPLMCTIRGLDSFLLNKRKTKA